MKEPVLTSKTPVSGSRATLGLDGHGDNGSAISTAERAVSAETSAKTSKTSVAVIAVVAVVEVSEGDGHTAGHNNREYHGDLHVSWQIHRKKTVNWLE